MHSTETVNQFLNLRAQGWSFARIADHLHVSKPTLLDWSNKHQSQLQAVKANQERSAQEAAQASRALQLEHLTLFQTTLRQELIKRTLKNLSDEEIEALATDIEHQIEKLNGQPSVNLSSKVPLRKEGKETFRASNGN
jgi:transcriptional regulator